MTMKYKTSLSVIKSHVRKDFVYERHPSSPNLISICIIRTSRYSKSKGREQVDASPRSIQGQPQAVADYRRYEWLLTLPSGIKHGLRQLLGTRNYYADPTANTAIANVDRALRRERKRQEEEKRREEMRRRGLGPGGENR